MCSSDLTVPKLPCSCGSILPLQVTCRGPLTPGWQKSALSCNYKLLTVRMAGPDIYPTR